MTGGRVLRAGRHPGCCQTSPATVAPGLLSCVSAFHAAAALAIILALGACSQSPPPVTSAPRNPAVCEALRPALPISYSSSRDTPETVRGVRHANARFTAACP